MMLLKKGQILNNEIGCSAMLKLLFDSLNKIGFGKIKAIIGVGSLTWVMVISHCLNFYN
jgi:hypothetical protein